MLFKNIKANIEEKNMWELLQKFSTLDRLSGEEDANKAADYITEKLEAFGIDYKCYDFDGYVSNPIESELEVKIANLEKKFQSRPRSFSKNVPEGVEGVLWYDKEGTMESIQADYGEKVKNKIVLSFNYNEDYAKKLSELGALGLIQIWSSDEEIIHEDTVGCVWGTPTLGTEAELPRIPVIGITFNSGNDLIAAIDKETCIATIMTRIDYQIKTLRLPVAIIGGKSKDFCLLSGHYDSWHYGVTDNGTGNALCLELARIFNLNKEKMEKGLVIAWWPGHSNGRYAGSTWFCDQNWSALNKHCYAHINIDSPGCLGAERVAIGTTRFEGTNYIENIIKECTGWDVKEYCQLFKGADQSFFGCRIPIHIYPMYKQADGNKQYASPGSGGGWWWHTTEDTLDKVDMKILVRDTIYIAEIISGIVFKKVIPYDMDGYFSYIYAIIDDYDKNSDQTFDFTPIRKSMINLRRTWEVCSNDFDEEQENLIVKLIGGELNRLMNSYSERYDFDLAIPKKIFPGIAIAEDIKDINCDKKQYLFLLTEFIRQRNRLVEELDKLEKECYFALSNINRMRKERENVSLCK